MEATNRQEKRQPDDSLRGTWIVDRPGRPNPFGVQWRETVWNERTGKETEKRPTEFFQRENERDKRRAEIAANKRLGKPSTASRDDLRQWQAFTIAAKGIPWQEILSGYHAHLKATGTRPCTETVATYGATYLAAEKRKMDAGELSEDGERHKRRAIREITARLGHVGLDLVTAPMLEQMVDDMGHASKATFNGYRKLYFAFFNSAVTAKILSENPVAAMKRRKHFTDNRNFITTPQATAKLFAFVMDHPSFKKIVGRLALEAFLGVRFSSSYRSSKEDIHFEDRGVLLPAFKLKTGKESGVGHYVDTTIYAGLEPLWEWLAISPDEGWKLTARQYMELKSAAFVAAGVPHPKNCLRKNFATYDLAAHGKPSRTAYLLGHVDETELWNDYKGNATSSQGRLYQMISPSTCRQIASGELQPAPNLHRKGPAPQDGFSSDDHPRHKA